MAESEDRVFSDLPSIDDGAIGGIWDANFDQPRITGHRTNHARWNGKWFASKDSELHDLVSRPHGYIGDAYGEPTRPDVDDNIVLVIDTASNTVVDTIPVGQNPLAIAFARVTPHRSSEQ